MGIRILVSDNEIDLFEGTQDNFAQTFTVGSINDIKTIQTSFSISFTVPKTSVNRNVFDIVFNSNSIDNYTIKDCHVLVDGVPIIGVKNKGQIVVNRILNDSIEVAIYCNNFGLFNTIKSLNTSDLVSVPDLSHVWNPKTIRFLYDNNYNDWYSYAISSYGVFQESKLNTFPITRSAFQHPHFFVRPFFESIFSEQGFTVEGDFMNDDNYSTLAIPFSSEKPSVCASAIYEESLNFELERSESKGLLFDYHGDLNNIALEKNVRVEGVDNFPRADILRLKVDNDGVNSVRLRLGYESSTTFGVPSAAEIRLEVRKNDFALIGTEIINRDTTGVEFVEFTFDNPNLNDLKKDDYVYVLITQVEDIPAPVVPSTTDITVSYLDFSLGYFDYNKNKLKVNQLDLVKSIMQYYDLVAVVDYISNVIKFIKISDIKSDVEDWSDKIDFSKNWEYELHPFDFSQNNTYEYANQVNSGVLVIDDNTLESESTVLTSKFNGCEETPITSASIESCVYDRYTEDIEEIITPLKVSNTQITFEDGQDVSVKDNQIVWVSETSDYNRFAIVNGDQDLNNGTVLNIRTIFNPIPDVGFQSGKFTILNKTSFSESSAPFLTSLERIENILIYNVQLSDFCITAPVSNFMNVAKFESKGLDFQSIIDNNYTGTSEYLNRYKLLKINVNLTTVDILNLNFLKAKYINVTDRYGNQINGLFYLNKVDQYQPNKTTRCELLKLQ